MLARQGHRLLQLGVVMLLFTSFEGFAIPAMAVPIVGRSTHTLSALLAVIFLVMGLLWTRLDLGAMPARVAFWFLIYSGLAIDAAFFIAAITGAGHSTMPLSGAHKGSTGQELVIMGISYTSAPIGIISFALILWGLRNMPAHAMDRP